MMVELGAAHALNLDGGGSSTMLAREPGAADVQVENSPSDGGERHVPNGLALLRAPRAAASSSGFWVETASDPGKAPGAAPVAGGRPDRVFPGLTRAADRRRLRRDLRPGGRHPVLARRAGHRTASSATACSMRLVARPDDGHRLPRRRQGHRWSSPCCSRCSGSAPPSTGSAWPARTARPRSASSATTTTATPRPIEPADLTLDYDHALFEMTPADGTGYFTVKSQEARPRRGLITAKVGEHQHRRARHRRASTDRPVADFDDAAQWSSPRPGPPARCRAAPGQSGAGLKLSYDFTQSTATRAAYASPPQQIAVAGQPQAFGLWINGHGKGEWPSLHLYDAPGTVAAPARPVHHLDRLEVRRVRRAARHQLPAQVRRFYVAETKADAQYTSEIAHRRPGGQGAAVGRRRRPPRRSPTDRWSSRRPWPTMPWRFAVMSDAQFVARDPDSDIVAAAPAVRCARSRPPSPTSC